MLFETNTAFLKGRSVFSGWCAPFLAVCRPLSSLVSCRLSLQEVSIASVSPCLSPLIFLNLLVSSPPGLPSHSSVLILLPFVVWLAFLLLECTAYTIQCRILFLPVSAPSTRGLSHSQIFIGHLYAATSKFILQAATSPQTGATSITTD